jgi:hypothetical protein
MKVRAQIHFPPRTRVICFDSQELHQLKNSLIVENWSGVSNGFCGGKAMQ